MAGNFGGLSFPARLRFWFLGFSAGCEAECAKFLRHMEVRLLSMGRLPCHVMPGFGAAFHSVEIRPPDCCGIKFICNRLHWDCHFSDPNLPFLVHMYGPYQSAL